MKILSVKELMALPSTTCPNCRVEHFNQDIKQRGGKCPKCGFPVVIEEKPCLH